MTSIGSVWSCAPDALLSEIPNKSDWTRHGNPGEILLNLAETNNSPSVLDSHVRMVPCILGSESQVTGLPGPT